MSDQLPERLIDSRELLTMIPVTAMTVWRWEEADKFPKRIKLNGGRCFWRLTAVLDWIDTQEATTDV